MTRAHALLLTAAILAIGTASARSAWTGADLPASAQAYYRTTWGIEILGLKPVSSGAMIRFSYRVVDASHARALHDKRVKPLLVDQRSGTGLVVPTMEKVGELRQTATPENGREYWMLFSNKGNVVHAGSRVDVVIGGFRANNLVVRPE